MGGSEVLEELKQDLEKLKDREKAQILSRYFKTGKGEYAEGDIFLGISVPQQRIIARKYQDINLEQIKNLLSSKIHEYRLTGLLILVLKYQKSSEKTKKEIVDFYLKNLKCVNNWDLVDTTADLILGKYLLNKDKPILYRLAKSNNLWERRVAIISCREFVKNNLFTDSLKISQILLFDKHDLIHKAVGWVLREIGDKNQKVEENFLKKFHHQMPRTMLRYAIEKFDKTKRKSYLNKS